MKRLCDQSKPSLITLKNQLYFAKHYHDRGKRIYNSSFSRFYFINYYILCGFILFSDETVKKHRLRLHQKTRPLVAEICETSKLDTGKDTERFYQRILAVITLLSGLGSPAIPSILRYVSHNNKTHIHIMI